MDKGKAKQDESSSRLYSLSITAEMEDQGGPSGTHTPIEAEVRFLYDFSRSQSNY